MTFSVRWSNSNELWDQAHRDLADPAYSQGRYAEERLRGRVQLEYEGRELFPPVDPKVLQETYERIHRRAEQHGRPRQEMIDASALWGGSCSMVDFARFIAWYLEIRDDELANDGQTLEFRDADGGMRLRFTQDNDDIVIESDRTLGSLEVLRLTVPEDEFYAGLRRFLTEFADAARENAPGMLEWKILERVRVYESR